MEVNYVGLVMKCCVIKVLQKMFLWNLFNLDMSCTRIIKLNLFLIKSTN